MDPLTVIGLVSNIISFVDFGAKIFAGAREIQKSGSGTLEENRSLERVVRDVKGFSSKLLTPEGASFIGEDGRLCELAGECRALCDALVQLLEKIKVKDPKSRTQSFVSVMKSFVHQAEKKELQQRLDYCRSQLELQLNYISKSVQSSPPEISFRLECLFHI
jgi:hypothetical protein